MSFMLLLALFPMICYATQQNDEFPEVLEVAPDAGANASTVVPETAPSAPPRHVALTEFASRSLPAQVHLKKNPEVEKLDGVR